MTERIELDAVEQAANALLLEMQTLLGLAADGVGRQESEYFYLFSATILDRAQQLRDVLAHLENRRWDERMAAKVAA